MLLTEISHHLLWCYRLRARPLSSSFPFFMYRINFLAHLRVWAVPVVATKVYVGLPFHPSITASMTSFATSADSATQQPPQASWTTYKQRGDAVHCEVDPSSL
jgi:hypothetical protein